MARAWFILLLSAATSVAQESPHGDIKAACSECHGTDSWAMRNDASFDHATTGFTLTGQHKSVKCASCHEGLKFAGNEQTCSSCHTDVHKAELGASCARCHTSQAWQVPDMIQKHQQTRFPLLGAHAGIDCQSCHVNVADHQYAGTPTECIGCHRTDFQLTKAPNHSAAGFSTDCQRCHQVTSVVWGHGFDHNQTAFPLQGAHASVACISCHQNQTFKAAPTDCYTCHSAQFASTTSPNHVAGRYSTDCRTCHTSMAWRPATFDHNTTRFPLTGAHVALACTQCHINNQFQNLPLTCFECHTNDFTNTRNPNHVTGNYSHECTQCHTTTSWEGASFNHDLTNFPLTGAHTATQCQSCHTNNNYQLSFNDCYQCHQTQFAQPTNPNHLAGNFSHDCRPCHNTSVWRPSTFNHSTTSYPLTGAHQAVSCSSCHVNNQYQNLPTDCYGCHATNFNTATNPNHQALNFSHNCVECHTTAAWSPAAFNHGTTNFPLTGAHVSTQCQTCHTNGNYQLVFTDCYQCHQVQFAQPTNPNHVAGNFNHDCRPCHTTMAWQPSTFNHNNTSFPLTGAHQAATCTQCHVNNVYQGLPSTCYDCHAANFNTANNPNHQALNFSHNCMECHSTSAWSPASFNHNTTNFPLTGAHISAQCQSCHVNGNYQLVFNDCYQCHQVQFGQPTNPNHVAGNFSHDCRPCHTTTVWRPSTFNHNNTSFPLTGAHQAATCTQCHVNNVYQGLPSTCYDCHAANFNTANNPNHQALNFPHECTMCHTTSAWTPATFNHSTTNFPLTGAHIAAQCQTCHIGGNYQLVFVDCYQCHQAQFAQPTNPNHVAGNFNHDCRPCHTTTAWAPSTFSHNTTSFPLTGAHQAVACSQCHINNVYHGLPSTCYDCHTTDFNNTTNPNHQTLNFPHDCTQCHTTTAWSPATFNHSTTNFPLTGAHVTTQCQACHVNGNYQLVYTDCYQCHATQFQQVANPNHVTQLFSHNCTQCHSTSVWRPNTMNHDASWFRIYSGHHLNRWTQCSQCHTTPGNLGAWSCTTGCHQNAHNQGQNCYGCHRNAL